MTREQAKRLARQIFDEFDEQIVEATSGTAIPPSFIAGLIANEAGKDRSGRIVRGATRFEAHVYRQLYAVRGGQRASYNKITQADIRDASDAALRALSTSYEATQIMGWHVVKNLRCTIADLRNPDKHFFYTVKLLQLNGFPAGAAEARMDREMKQWNSGSETGRTYHHDYVVNARLVRAAYRELEAGRSRPDPIRLADLDSGPDDQPDVVFESFEDETNLEIPDFAAGGSTGVSGHAPTEDVPASPLAAGDTPASNAQPPQQVAENITNVNQGDALPVDFVEEEKTITAPPPTGFMAKLKMQVGAAVAFIGGGAGLKEFFGVELSPGTVELLKILLPTVLGLGFIGFLFWYVTEKVVGFKTLKLKGELAADPKKHNLHIRPQ